MMTKSMKGHPQVRYFDIQRRVVANKTSEGWRTVPHASILLELDVTHLLAFVHRLKVSPEYAGVRVTMNSVLLKAIAESLKCSPEMNAHVEYNEATAVGRVTLFDAINIAIPFRTADGRMISPVLSNVDTRSLRDVCVAMSELRKRVANTHLDLLLFEAGFQDTLRRLLRGHVGVLRRLYANLAGRSRLARIPRDVRKRYTSIPPEQRITPENLTSATVLVTNVGSVISGMNCVIEMLQIIPPQTSAIGLGSITRKPWVVRADDGEESIAVRDILPLTLCFDHRVMDMEHLLGFLNRIWELCQDPSELAGRSDSAGTLPYAAPPISERI